MAYRPPLFYLLFCSTSFTEVSKLFVGSPAFCSSYISGIFSLCCSCYFNGVLMCVSSTKFQLLPFSWNRIHVRYLVQISLTLGGSFSINPYLLRNLFSHFSDNSILKLNRRRSSGLVPSSHCSKVSSYTILGHHIPPLCWNLRYRSFDMDQLKDRRDHFFGHITAERHRDIVQKFLRRYYVLRSWSSGLSV